MDGYTATRFTACCLYQDMDIYVPLIFAGGTEPPSCCMGQRHMTLELICGIYSGTSNKEHSETKDTSV